MYPRRYITRFGVTTLIGLTAEETREFEDLDSTEPLGAESQTPSHRDRLIILYLKHQSAYDHMMRADAGPTLT
jgi:hypothetical protein